MQGSHELKMMTRRQAIRYTTAGFFLPAIQAGIIERSRGLDAVDLVRRSGPVDMLSLLTADWRKLDQWCTSPKAFRSEDLEKVRRCGVGLFHPAVRVPSSNPRVSAERWLRKWRRFASFHPSAFRVVERADQLEATPGGPVGILLGMQDSEHLRHPEDVDLFREIGQRVSQLTYNGPSRFGSGCRVRRDAGLTQQGVELVRALNRSGIAVDVSHCGRNTSLEAIAASDRPVLVTHSNCRALNPRQPRCKSDETIRALARRGGVFGVSMIRNFVAPHSDEATFDRYLDHFDHVANLVGPEHLGIGSDSDLDGRQPVLRDIDSVDFLYAVAAGLLDRGYSPEDVVGILGGNFRRVLAATMPPPVA